MRSRGIGAVAAAGALLLTGIQAPAALAAPAAAAAPTAGVGAVEVTGGSLTWGVRTSIRNYLENFGHTE
ncbi:MAG: hypothetical protein ACTHZX_08815, partial [Microbacterium sp.]